MADLLYVLTALAFFALAAGYVRACDRIVRRGQDDDGSREGSR